MTVPEYTAGSWVAAARPGFLALLGEGVTDQDVREVWAGADGGVVGALAVLARDGLTGLPPFALVAVSGQRVHVALRGDVGVVLTDDDGEQVLRSGEVSTWSERVVEGVVQVELRAERPGVVSQTVVWPLADGIVRAGSVRLSLKAQGDDAADDAPEEVADEAHEAAAASEQRADVPAEVASSAVLPALAQVPGLVVEDDDAPRQDGPVTAAPVVQEPAAPEPAVHGPAAQAWADEVVAVAESFLGGPRHASVEIGASSHDDHDGLTILSTDLASIRDQLPSWASDEVPGPFHVPAPTPVPARLVLSTGLVVELDRPVLLGRAPQVARVSNRELPHLVTVPSPQQDISRTHAEVRVEGEDVLVTDLDSTNGVHVSRAGQGARRLHPGEASVVGAGEVVDLGDGVTFTVERGS